MLITEWKHAWQSCLWIIQYQTLRRQNAFPLFWLYAQLLIKRNTWTAAKDCSGIYVFVLVSNILCLKGYFSVIWHSTSWVKEYQSNLGATINLSPSVMLDYSILHMLALKANTTCLEMTRTIISFLVLPSTVLYIAPKTTYALWKFRISMVKLPC